MNYTSLISDEEFFIYSRLREIWNNLAKEKRMPFYPILEYEHLAEISIKKLKTEKELMMIPGIGNDRVETDGCLFLLDI